MQLAFYCIHFQTMVQRMLTKFHPHTHLHQSLSWFSVYFDELKLKLYVPKLFKHVFHQGKIHHHSPHC